MFLKILKITFKAISNEKNIMLIVKAKFMKIKYMNFLYSLTSIFNLDKSTLNIFGKIIFCINSINMHKNIIIKKLI